MFDLLVLSGFLLYNYSMIYFARHGQTDADKQNRFNGGIDLDLNEIGISQAQKQAEKLSDIKFDYVFCSPKKRAVQTCEIISKGRKFRVDERLKELVCGIFDGKKKNVISGLRFLNAFKKGKLGVEHIENFTARNVDFCADIVENSKDKTILIVSHNGNVMVFDYFFKGQPKGYRFTKRILQNGELIKFEF